MTLDIDLEDDSSPIPLGAGEAEDAPPFDPTTIAAINERFKRGADRMDRFEARMGGLELSVDANTVLTKADHDMTKDVHEIIVAAKKFFFYLSKIGAGIARTVVWSRKAIIWVAAPVGACVAVYHSVKAALHLGGGS